MSEQAFGPLWGFDWPARAVGIVAATTLVAMSMAGGILASQPGQPSTLQTVNSTWFEQLSGQTAMVGRLCDQASQVKVPPVMAADTLIQVGNARLSMAVKNACTSDGTLARLQQALDTPQVWTTRSYFELSNKGADAMIEMQASLSFLDTAIQQTQLAQAQTNFTEAKDSADPLIIQGQLVLDSSAGNVADESTRTDLQTELTSCQAASSISTTVIADLSAAAVVLEDCATKLPQIIANVVTSQQVYSSRPKATPTATPTMPAPTTPAPQVTAPPVPYDPGVQPVITNVSLITDFGSWITVSVTVWDPNNVGYNLCVGSGSVQGFRYDWQWGTSTYSASFAIENELPSPWATFC